MGNKKTKKYKHSYKPTYPPIKKVIVHSIKGVEAELNYSEPLKTNLPSKKFTQHKKKYIEYLKSVEWSEKKKSVFKEKGRKCSKCKEMANLDVHHKTYKNIFNENIDDLEVLCRKCHGKEHGINIHKC